MGVDAEAEQLRLVHQPLLLEQLYGVVGADGAFFNRQRLGGQLPHPLLHPVQQGLVQGKGAQRTDKEGPAEGALHTDALHVFPACHVIKCLQHQKNRAALIRLDARNILGGDHLQRTVPVQGLVELTQLSIPVHQQDIIGEARLDIRRDGAVGRPLGIGIFHTVYHDLYHSLFFHMAAS